MAQIGGLRLVSVDRRSRVGLAQEAPPDELFLRSEVWHQLLEEVPELEPSPIRLDGLSRMLPRALLGGCFRESPNRAVARVRHLAI